MHEVNKERVSVFRVRFIANSTSVPPERLTREFSVWVNRIQPRWTGSECVVEIKANSKPRPHFRKSDHLAVVLLPAFKQRLKSKAPELQTTKRWSQEAEKWLQDHFESVDWVMFKDTSVDLNEYSVDKRVPTKSFQVFTNQIQNLLRARSVTFRSGDQEKHKRSMYLMGKVEFPESPDFLSQ